MALPSPPFTNVCGVQNFRDVGGYPIRGAEGSIRRHFLYRSAATHRIKPAGEQVVRDVLGITTVYDLRSQTEIADVAGTCPKVARIDGVEYVYAPVFPTEDHGPEALALKYKDYAEGGVAGFTRAYADVLANAGAAVRRVVEHIRDRSNQPLLVHCSGGKDRTGVVVALILSVAGASDETVANEYALTERGLAPTKTAMVKRLANTTALKGDKEKAGRMIQAKKEYMLEALKMMQEKYGGAGEYLKKECGQSDQDIEKIRKNMRSRQFPILQV